MNWGPVAMVVFLLAGACSTCGSSTGRPGAGSRVPYGGEEARAREAAEAARRKAEAQAAAEARARQGAEAQAAIEVRARQKLEACLATAEAELARFRLGQS